MGANESKRAHGSGGHSAGGKKHKQKKEEAVQSPVLTWGDGAAGQMGLGQQIATTLQPSPIPALAQVAICSVTCGPEHTAFLTDGGTVYMSGNGADHRLGLGHTNNVWVPQVLSFSESNPVQQVACGSTFTLFLTRRGIIYSCGSSKHGALGQRENTCVKEPTKINRLMSVIQISCGLRHCAALTKQGEVHTWGDPSDGALAHGELDYSDKLQMRQGMPKLVESSYTARTRFIDIACGNSHTIFLSEKGEVCCAGRGAEGQLGYGGKQEHPFPRKIDVELERNGEETVVIQGVRVFAGATSSGVISVEGDFYFWGDGQLVPDRVEGATGKIVHAALHSQNGMLLTEHNKVFTYDTEELSMSDLLVVAPAPWSAPPISWVACGAKHFVAVLGEDIPDLTGDRQLVQSSVVGLQQEKEATQERAQLFATTEPARRRVLQEDVKTNTPLDQMKSELFALPSKPKPSAADVGAKSSNASAARDELFAKPYRKEEQRPMKEREDKKAEQREEPEDLDDFKKELFGSSAPMFPTSTPSDPAPESSDSEEYLDELPDDCTLRGPVAPRPNHLRDSDLPDVETLDGADMLEDDDLL